MEVFLTCPCTELLYINSTDLQLQIKLQLHHLAKTHPDTLQLHPKSLTLCNARYPGQMTARLLLGKSILLKKLCKFPSSHCPRSISPTPSSNPLTEFVPKLHKANVLQHFSDILLYLMKDANIFT